MALVFFAFSRMLGSQGKWENGKVEEEAGSKPGTQSASSTAARGPGTACGVTVTARAWKRAFAATLLLPLLRRPPDQRANGPDRCGLFNLLSGPWFFPRRVRTWFFIFFLPCFCGSWSRTIMMGERPLQLLEGGLRVAGGPRSGVHKL